MKKRIYAIILCIVFILSILCYYFARVESPVSFSTLSADSFSLTALSADPLSFSALSAAAYAMGSSMGIQWGFTGSAAAAQSQMVAQLQNFAGSDLIEWWGQGEIRSLAGKLVVAQTAYEGVKGVYEHLKDFLDYLIDNQKTPILSDGDYVSGEILEPVSTPSDTGFSVVDTSYGQYAQAELYYYGVHVATNLAVINAGATITTFEPQVKILSRGRGVFILHVKDSKGLEKTERYTFGYTSIDYAGSYIDYQNADKSLYPQALPLEASWQGDWGEAPDTNLQQLIGSVFDNLADLGDIDVTGDIVEPAPVPTPVPTYPPATDVLGGINTEIEQGNDVIQGLNDIQDLMEGVNEGLNDIDLGIGQAAGNISDAVGEAAEGVGQAIGTQTGVISGAINQAVSDVQTAIGEQTAALDESLSATAEGVETIAEAIEDEPINWQKFDLRGLFPFCIPFDIYNMLEALDASPTAPHVQLPFVIESIGFSYTIDLDFSAFDQVAAVMRQMELIVYGIALAWATSKVIKW